MKVLLFVNTRKDENLSFTKGIETCLKKKNIDYTLFKSAADDTPVFSGLLDGVNLIIVLGGDGTMLHGARVAAGRGILLFGVNIGNLGFLTESDYKDFESSLDKILAGDYFTEERMLLNVKGEELLVAVNDVCLISCEPGKMLSVSVKINESLVESFGGDGIIISSPTGSTGYSMSAGGPIVSPQASCIIITPICAHSLAIKPLVLCDSDIITIDVEGNKKGLAILDGQKRVEVTSIQVEKSKAKVKFIRFSDYSFFNVLSKKFNNNKG